MSNEEFIEYATGELVLLECGQYSDRFNAGLFRVTRPFSLLDLPEFGDPGKLRVDRYASGIFIGRELPDEFRDAHMERVAFRELNIDDIETLVPADQVAGIRLRLLWEKALDKLTGKERAALGLDEA